MYDGTFAQSSPRSRVHLRTARFVSPFSDVLLSLCISFSPILSPRATRELFFVSFSLSILVTDDSSSLSSAPCSSSIISLRPMRLYELEYTIHMRRALIYICMRPVRAFYMHRHARPDASENTYKSARTMSSIWAPPMNGETSSDAAGSTWTLFKSSVRPFIRVNLTNFLNFTLSEHS